MHKESNGMNRRQFLQTSAASAMFLGLGGVSSLAASDSAKGSIPWLKLNNGVKMPRLGLGTMTLDSPDGPELVAHAIGLGYRLIDTATVYNSEKNVGEGIRQSGIDRKELFITTKLWKSDMGYDKAKIGFQTSIDKIGTDYLDLYLIHRPSGGDWKGSWKAMEELHQAGKIKAIGMSNADFDQLDWLMANAEVKPALHQIETHAFFQEDAEHDYLKKHGIQMEAWSPLAEGRHGLFTNATLAAIASKHNKSVAQVCVRWHYQRGVIAIPRSHKKAHIAENIDILDFKLDDSEVASIASLDLNTTQFPEWS
ncbi:MAG TPA: aldo/keto reductase [Verrucomicrobiae bacterium]